MSGVFTDVNEVNVGAFAYFRTIPKTLAREIAERTVDSLQDTHGIVPPVDIIEAAINACA